MTKSLFNNKWEHGSWYFGKDDYPEFSSGPFRKMLVHRFMATVMLGRRLRKDEDIHHINEIRFDFRPENLQVLGHREHGAVSSRQRWFLKQQQDREKKEWDAYYDEATETPQEQDSQFADTSFEVSSFGTE